jgi:hypothetical protein
VALPVGIEPSGTNGADAPTRQPEQMAGSSEEKSNGVPTEEADAPRAGG